MTSAKAIEFYAYLPPIQSAIMKSGEGDLMQVKLNINLLISPEAAKLMLMTQKRLRVIVEEMPEVILTKIDDETEKGTERKSIRINRRRR